jgi:hypothetical protein
MWHHTGKIRKHFRMGKPFQHFRRLKSVEVQLEKLKIV